MKKPQSLIYLSLISFLVVVYLMITVLSCSDNITNPNDTGTSTISGKIENWYYGSDKKIILTASALSTQYLDTANISADGSFSLRFNKPDDSTYIVFTHEDECFSDVQINPPGVKLVSLSLDVYSDTEYWGSVSQQSDTSLIWNDGHMIKVPVYFSNAGSINGRDSCIESLNRIVVTKYKMNFKAKELTNITVIFRMYSPDYEELFITTDTYDLKWYFTRFEQDKIMKDKLLNK